MAADSRLTLTKRIDQNNGPSIVTKVPASDANTKLFSTPHGIGIATFGDASVAAEPIAGHVEAFIREEASSESASPEDVAKGLCDYFNKLPTPPDTGFHVSGYATEHGKRIPHVWRAGIRGNQCNRVNNGTDCGATWNGETALTSRLFAQVYTKVSETHFTPLGATEVAWNFFTLQDAIDFACFATRSTIDFIRFQPVSQTVGGPIDVLVIRPSEFNWLAKKSLTVG